MSPLTPRPPGVLRSWLNERLAIRHPTLWFGVWAVVAVALNGTGGYLAVRAWSPPPDVLYLEFAADETRVAPDSAATLAIPLANTDATATAPVTVMFSIDDVEQPPQQFPARTSAPFVLRLPLPRALQSSRTVKVAIKSVRGAVLGSRTGTRLVIPATEFVTFRNAEIVVPFGNSFPGAEVYASSPLTGAVGYAIERTDGKPTAGERPLAKRGEQNWQLPADAIEAPEWGQTYGVQLKPPSGARTGDVGKLLVRYEPTPQLYALDLKATPTSVRADDNKAGKVTFTARLSGTPSQEVQLPIALSGTGANWVEGPLETTIKIVPPETSGSVDVALKKREYPAAASELLATLKVPELYRAPTDKADATRSASVALSAAAAPDPLTLVVRKFGDPTLEQGRAAVKLKIECTLSRKAETAFDVAIEYDGAAKLDKHFRIAGLADPTKISFQPGSNSATFTLEPIPNLNLQPDREVRLAFKGPASPKLTIVDGTISVTLTDNLAKRKLLVLVLAPGPNEQEEFLNTWAKHWDAWKKADAQKYGEETWCRAVAVGATAQDANLKAKLALVGSGPEAELPQVTDGGNRKRSPSLKKLLDLAVTARRELISELPAQLQSEIQTAIVWRSTKSPTDLRAGASAEVLDPKTADDLKDLKSRFAFVWYGYGDGSTDANFDKELSAVLVKPLEDLWATTARPVVRLVQPDDAATTIPNGVTKAFDTYKTSK